MSLLYRLQWQRGGDQSPVTMVLYIYEVTRLCLIGDGSQAPIIIWSETSKTYAATRDARRSGGWCRLWQLATVNSYGDTMMVKAVSTWVRNKTRTKKRPDYKGQWHQALTCWSVLPRMAQGGPEWSRMTQDGPDSQMRPGVPIMTFLRRWQSKGDKSL